MAAINDTYHNLLMDYAAGTLDEAYALVIAAHLSLSPSARKTVSQYETIGGGLLHDCCAPVAMKETSLQSVLDRLDDCANHEEGSRPCTKEEILCAEMKAMPSCLRAYLEPQHDHLPWKKSGQGLHAIMVKTASCRCSQVEVIKLTQGTSLPRHSKPGYALTLVLKGALEESGQVFSRGDIVILENLSAPSPVARQDDCLCVAVTCAPSRVSSFLKNLLQSFRRA